ncbi:uncharacterized protein LOC126092923 [Schistocerca cancellata]|uniref:uncharacterized protein LOC126092923 n=1 Tax=Schistocerca cancellata TaxID=274614 RepID=UPI002117A228|nr:uncharacterized protein LOC126092923 [Schistocerca cancellata]
MSYFASQPAGHLVPGTSGLEQRSRPAETSGEGRERPSGSRVSAEGQLEGGTTEGDRGRPFPEGSAPLEKRQPQQSEGEKQQPQPGGSRKRGRAGERRVKGATKRRGRRKGRKAAQGEEESTSASLSTTEGSCSGSASDDEGEMEEEMEGEAEEEGGSASVSASGCEQQNGVPSSGSHTHGDTSSSSTQSSAFRARLAWLHAAERGSADSWQQ